MTTQTDEPMLNPEAAVAETLLRKHMAMYDWSPGEQRAINDFILTTRHGIGEEIMERLGDSLNALSGLVHESNKKWWVSVEDGVTPLKRNKGELLMLVVSEVAEAMEGERKELMDDKLPHRKMAEVELADVLIRVFDYCGAFGYDLSGAFREKMAFNRVREDHTHEARKIAGGKQF
jgi:NTP pyrophosphatase (non-canonical NTP hydrolase)